MHAWSRIILEDELDERILQPDVYKVYKESMHEVLATLTHNTDYYWLAIACHMNANWEVVHIQLWRTFFVFLTVATTPFWVSDIKKYS